MTAIRRSHSLAGINTALQKRERSPLSRRLRIETLEARRLLALYIVDTFTDSVGGICGNGGVGNLNCSLRSAIITANTNPGPDEISLVPGTYNLSLTATPTSLDPEAGDLNINDDVTISGNTSVPTATVIDANQIDRVFNVRRPDPFSPSQGPTLVTAIFAGLTIQGGRVTDALPGGGISGDNRTDIELRQTIVRNNVIDASVMNGGDGDGGGIATSGNLLLDNATITNNNALNFGGGIAMFDDGTLSIRDSIISANTAGLDGGGIWAGNNANYQINLFETVAINGNQAGPTSRGGGLYVDGSSAAASVSLSLVNFTGNTSGDAGGGAYVQGVGTFNQDRGRYENNQSSDGDGFGGGGGLYLIDNGTSVVDGTIFRNNVSVSGGGGAAILTNATLRNTVFDNNRTTSNAGPGVARFDDGGGAIAISTSSGIVGPTVRIESSSILNNTAPLAGGIGAVNSNVDIVSSVIRGNRATDSFPGAGGIGFAQDDTDGIVADRVRLTISGSTISTNTSSSDAGGIGVADADATITNSTISGNQASGRGAGIGIIGLNNAPNLRLDRVTVDNNTAGTDGGGIAVADASFFTTNTTISNNIASNNGGGIAFATANPLLTGAVEFSTIASNRAGIVGGNVAVNGSVTRFLSSIVADPLGNAPIINIVSGGPGQVISQGFNIFSNSNFSNPSPSDLLGVDPLLGPLANNGGTVRTRALLASSPAIDAGATVIQAFDARGIARPIDGNGDSIARNDIGAFEAAAVLTTSDLAITMTAETITGASIPAAGIASGATFVYRIAVQNTGLATATNVTVSDTLPPGLAFVSGVVSGGASIGSNVSFNPTTNIVTTTFPTVTQASGVTTIVLTVSVAATASGIVTNTATISNIPDNDPNAANDTASVTLNIVPPQSVDASITMTGPAQAFASDAIEYAIAIRNNGTAPLSNVVVTDLLPAGVTFNSATLNGLVVINTGSGQNVVVTIPTLLSGATIVVRASIDSATRGVITNSATVNVTGDIDPTNNLSTLSTTVLPPALNVAHTLSTGTGDGSLTVGVDSFGQFGGFADIVTDALYDPLGPTQVESSVFLSEVGFRSSTTGAYQHLSESNTNVRLITPVSGTLTDATSVFSVGLFTVTLRQTVAPQQDSAGRTIGAELVQTYDFTNTDSFPVPLDLVRYLDADLLFDASVVDGGGIVDINGLRTLFETDSGGTGPINTTFVGISNPGANEATVNTYDVDDFEILTDRIFTQGAPLRDRVSGDLDGNGFVDLGNEYDVALALRRLLTVNPGATASFVTRTNFGGQPALVMPDISGIVACDSNGNGIDDPEERQTGVTVFIDRDGDRLLDSGERSTVTNASGFYQFVGLGVTTGDVANVVVQNPPLCKAAAPNIGVTRSGITTGLLSRSVEAVDVDNDGDSDLLVVNELGNNVSVLLNSGSGLFVPSAPILLGQRSLDIASWKRNANTPSVIAVASFGTVADKGSIQVIQNGSVTRQLTAGNGPVSVAVNDFNGDGEADFIAAASRSGTIVGRFSGESGERILATVRSPKSVTTAFLNDDSFIDLIVAGYGYEGDDSSEIVALLGDGRGGFTTLRQTIPGRGAVDVEVANFDGDPQDEVAIANYSGTVTIYDTATGILVPIRSVTTQVGVESIAARDVDEDGLIDLVIANSKQETVELFIGTPQGFFRNSVITGVPSPSDIAIADFDADGILDVAVANLYGAVRPSFTLPSAVTILGLTIREQNLTLTANSTTTANFAYVPSTPTPVTVRPMALRNFDVNTNGAVTPLDAMLVINQVSRSRRAEGETPRISARMKYDVNGDGLTTSLDALLVINELSRRSRGSRASGEQIVAPEQAKRNAAVDAAMLDIRSLF